ncbi:hypothetical protein EVAR_30881_1 [Eumeta japonica]|uniref:Mos1 transposase HTH domain-containing protein n=1 Tax=Eumeta variegata TaxID=151549 RepID=A0A4C1V397_EUMVA|nr:hypothetical protein EVAR_30881_1 [Eumeta japonica]
MHTVHTWKRGTQHADTRHATCAHTHTRTHADRHTDTIVKSSEELAPRDLKTSRSDENSIFENRDDTPSLATASNWFNFFKCGGNNVADDLGEGRRSMATTEDNIRAVRLMIETDKRVIHRQIQISFGIDKKVNPDWYFKNCLPLVLKKFGKSDLAARFSFTMTTPHDIPLDKQ